VEDGQRKLVLQGLAAAAVMWAATAFAQPGTATGTMTVNGQRFALRHAYASVQPGSFDEKTEDVRVLLSDIPLDDAARADSFALIRLGRAGKLHAVEVILDSKMTPIGGTIYVEAFNGMASVTGMHEFEPTVIERKLISGRMYMDGPRTFDKLTWQYDATFSAVIPRAPTEEETAVALKSPPGVAARAHVKAILTGFDAFVATLTQQSATAYRGPGGQDRYNELRAETPADSHVITLIERPDGTHVATVQGKRRDGVIIESVVKVRQEGGSWKVDRQ